MSCPPSEGDHRGCGGEQLDARCSMRIHITVLSKRCCRPPLPLPAPDLGGAPVHARPDHHHRATRQGLLLEAHHEAHLAQAGAGAPQREAPRGALGGLSRGDTPRPDQWHPILNGDRGALQLPRPAVGLPPVNAGRFQPVVLCAAPHPGLEPPGQDSDHIRGPGPRRRRRPPPRALCAAWRRLPGLSPGDGGPKRLGPGPNVGVLEPL
jgi:hypothetical protein